MFLIVYYLIVSALTAKCTTAQANCETNSCNVQIGDSLYCSQCEANYVPINGVCKQVSDPSIATAGCKKSDDKSVDAQSTTCGKCTKTGYFLHKGGCYDSTATPGQTICQTAGDIAGVCKTCNAANGFFRNPEAAPTVDSCISCGDATGVKVGSDNSAKTYKGVDGCKTCTLSTPATIATCTECAAGFLHTPAGEATSCVTECPTGYFGHTAATGDLKTCQSCSGTNNNLDPAAVGITGCAVCTYDNTKVTCTKCETGKYLKTTSDSTSCVAASECGSGFFPRADDKTGNKCAACDTVSDGGIDDCTECTPIPQASRAGTVAITCSKCGTKKVSPDKSSCVATCPENSNDDKTPNVCVCRDGFSLEGGKCVPPNTNRSALSTGAIAGISVAAVVVVGGLVGFLCWWFICRGKA